MERVNSQVQVSRRTLLTGGAGLAIAAGFAGPASALASRGLVRKVEPGRAIDRVAEVTVDLASEPAILDPANTYDADGWSIIHSIYDSLVQWGPGGELQPLIAESLTQTDPLTWSVKLRPGLTFHNGEPVDAAAVAFSLAHITNPETGSQIAGNFAVIESVETIDDLSVNFKLSAPAPWLPSQIASWFVLIPPVHGASGEWISKPVGTGPYTFVEAVPGEKIVLAANPTYFAGSPKGQPVADQVNYRFVGEGSTRVADLLAGDVQVIRNVPADQVAPVEDAGDVILPVPLSGCAWIRIPTDVAPFDDPKVRQALNYAVDVDAIIAGLLDGNGSRLANFFPAGGLGYDPDLAPFPHDPEKARALLAEAGYPDGFDTSIDFAVTERKEIIEAVAGQLAEVGIRATVAGQELALFNSPDWWLGKDPAAAPLRFVTWRPMFDPWTLLSLLVSNTGFLSRCDIPAVQALIDTFGTETDPAQRAATGIELGKALFDDPAAIYLYSLTSIFGQAADAPEWTPRADDYIIMTSQD